MLHDVATTLGIQSAGVPLWCTVWQNSTVYWVAMLSALHLSIKTYSLPRCRCLHTRCSLHAHCTEAVPQPSRVTIIVQRPLSLEPRAAVVSTHKKLISTTNPRQKPLAEGVSTYTGQSKQEGGSLDVMSLQ